MIAALPGLLLLLGCRTTLEYAQNNADFLPRTDYPSGYRWAVRGLIAGCALLIAWLLTLAVNAMGWLTLQGISSALFEGGIALLLAGIVCGTLLDFLSLRKTHRRLNL